MEFVQFRIEIPTWENGIWVSDTVFEDRDEFKEYVKGTFKIPGEYGFDETSAVFNEQARMYKKQGDVYCMHQFKSKDFIKYWEYEKKKCRNGAIFKHNDKEWYLPRDYYMWINFLPIFDKTKNITSFPQVWDVQLHIALYELLAELHYKHASIFKKRQIASSYFHMAKFINQIWFEKGVTLKMGASLKDYVGLEGSWEFLDQYKDFLNDKTAWYRPMNPGGEGKWIQQIEVTKNGNKVKKGNKSRLLSLSFEQKPTKGVGGPCKYFFYEEAGVAPTMDKTFEYMLSALEAGDLTTGMFIAAGSVGELKDAETLKQMTLYPEENDIYPVESNLIDDKGTVGKTGLFIPEQWGMPPYIDEHGNSEVERAMEALDKRRAEDKKKLKPDKYQLRISQRPRNIAEGFAFREEAVFPIHLVSQQKRRIEEKEYAYELIDIDEDAQGTIKVTKTSKPPIATFPIQVNKEDKEGSIVIWERPDPKPKFGQYIASIDPVSEGKTTTSESLCSIYIYKTATEVTTKKHDGTVETHIEGDKVVAAWCGRFDDINDTHKRLRLLIEWYNAYTIVENNISLFIQYMIAERKQKYLVPKNQMLFLKELQANKSVFQEYGWKNTGTLFKSHLISYLIEYLSEVIDEDIDDNGEIIKKYYGIERVPDIMAMVEMENYQPGVNVDRLVSLAALIAFVKIQQANRGKAVRVENEMEETLENSQKYHKLTNSGFRNIGRKKSLGGKRSRSPFKRMR